MADESNDELLEATTALLPALLGAFDAMSFAGRHMHPPNLPPLAEAMAEHQGPLSAGQAQFAAVAWPEHLQDFSKQLLNAATMADKGLQGLRDSVVDENPTMAGYRALGYLNRGLEYLYPLASMLPPISRFFLPREHRDDDALATKLNTPPSETTGVFHFQNAATERGGFSLYVPEYYSPEEPLPLVFALHGGSGHGRSFLWSWLSDARAAGAILVSPSSVDRTWSLMGDDVDANNLRSMLAHVQQNWRVNPEQLLIGGMSDGGTYTYLAGLVDDSPFTHLAPTSASFHPMLLEVASGERVQDLPIYLTHGALDWMFDVEMARTAQQALTAAGAAVEYREIEDLSHTYPREENGRILRWLKGQPLD